MAPPLGIAWALTQGPSSVRILRISSRSSSERLFYSTGNPPGVLYVTSLMEWRAGPPTDTMPWIAPTWEIDCRNIP